jgi:ABC-type Mn2+/Zn2+ transport system ATPase subunit
MSGIYNPNGGNVTYDGQAVFDNPSVKGRIAFVPDDLYLPPNMSIEDMAKRYENLYGRPLNRNKLSELAANLGLNTKQRFSTFSKGMRRQASTILALSLEAEYVFFDETFDGLDPFKRGYIKRLLKNEVKERGITVIISSHSLKELEDVAYGLQAGEISRPFLSTVGYHIVKMLERKQLEPFDSLHPQIHRFMERRGVHERLAADALDSLVQKYGGKYTTDQILDMETERLCAENKELKFLVKEYHDGLLLYELCSTQIWEPAKKDTLGMEKYFKANEKDYAWDKPHFSGMVFYCKNKADLKKVKKILKSEKDDSKWISLVRENFNQDSVMVRMDKRLFVLGENNNVDALIFKAKGASIIPLENYPYVGYVGKKLKKGPSKWTDVSTKVVQDYQKYCEDAYVAELRKKYPVVIFEEVLSTVNEH